VDYVFTGSRFKITLPSQNCIIMFSLAGAIVDKPYRIDVHPPKPDISVFDRQYPLSIENKIHFGNTALHYVRDKIFQRKVEISIKKLDAYSVFIGQLYLDGKDFGLQLLDIGYAQLHKASVRKFNFFNTYKTTEDTARQEKRGLWEFFNFEEEKKNIAEAVGKRPAPQERVNYPIVVTDVRTGSDFSFQILNEEETSALESLASSLQSEKFSSYPPIVPKLYDYVAALFTIDDLWYRAQIIKEQPYEVKYLDYGNREVLPLNRIRALPLEYVDILKPQAKDAKLYYLLAPAVDSEFGMDSKIALRDLLWEKILYAEQVRTDTIKLSATKEATLYQLIIHADKSDLNKLLIRSGHCKTERNYSDPQDPYYLTLQDLQEEARLQRRGIWQYGDDPDDDYD